MIGSSSSHSLLNNASNGNANVISTMNESIEVGTVITTEPSPSRPPTLPPLQIPTLSENLHPYSEIRIAEELWLSRIQDKGCAKEFLPKATYRQNKIPCYGPNDEYYYELASIAIDYIKSINLRKVEGLGWDGFPKNMTDVKVKIVGLLLEYRVSDADGMYHMNQSKLLQNLDTMWGSNNSASTLEDNDKIRVIGLLFLESNNEKLYRLSQGVQGRRDLDDPALSTKGIFQLLSLDFNNNEIKIELPDEAADVDGADELNPNDILRTRVRRDCKVYIYALFISLTTC